MAWKGSRPSEVTNNMAVEERIYIGGLDPPRLTARHILDRLQALSDLQIESVDERPDKAFCHVTAHSEHPETTALQMVAKQYHNVKWKGCRIVVSAARPTFLERLAEERLQRQKSKEENLENQKALEVGATSEKPESSKIPRRLRVRKKYGDEAFHVDTKPWSVDNWQNFSHAIGKSRRKVEKHIAFKTNADSSEAPVPLMHRSVHIRFNAELEGGRRGDRQEENDTLPQVAYDSNSDSGSDSQVSSDEDGSEEENVAEPKKSSYAWSDDSEDEDDGSAGDMESPSVVSEERESNLGAEPEPAAMEATEMSSESDEMSDVDEESKSSLPLDREGPSSDGDVQPVKPTADPQEDGQLTSTDESSEDESTSERVDRSGSLRPVTQTDEFAAGVDLDDDNWEEHSDDSGSSAGQVETMERDITNDVSSNLNLLSELFPEMASAKPAIAEVDPADKAGEKTRGSSNESGFEGGIMMRYDPNDVSTQKYVIQGDEDDAKESSSAKSDDDGESEETEPTGKEDQEDGHEDQEDGLDVGVKESSHVYEEGKLENVFREAREAWQSTEQETKDQGGGAFSFGFDLGGPAPPAKSASGSTTGSGEFSFGFEISEDADGAKSTSVSKDAGVSDQEHAPRGLDKGHGAEKPEHRRRGLNFSSDELQKYQTGFFSCNGGFEVLENGDEVWNTESAKEAWKKERQTLTLDWKRKRKHAQSRIQKKLKLR